VRLVDCFIDTIIHVRSLAPKMGADGPEFDEVQTDLLRMFEESESGIEAMGFNAETFNAAKFAIVAYVDEMILCSKWCEKGKWQRQSLQRKFFNTTNIGAEFYEKLAALSKQGPDRSVREVYSLCLGLGFKGKLFSNDERKQLEDIKDFNISLLMPEANQRNLDTAVLFPTAYSGHSHEGKGDYKPRMNIMPMIFGIPAVLVLAVAFYYHTTISKMINDIISVVS